MSCVGQDAELQEIHDLKRGIRCTSWYTVCVMQGRKCPFIGGVHVLVLLYCQNSFVDCHTVTVPCVHTTRAQLYISIHVPAFNLAPLQILKQTLEHGLSPRTTTTLVRLAERGGHWFYARPVLGCAQVYFLSWNRASVGEVGGWEIEYRVHGKVLKRTCAACHICVRL